MSKIIRITITDDSAEYDFDGFENNECGDEEDVIRFILARMGAMSHVEHSDNKRETEIEKISEPEKVRS